MLVGRVVDHQLGDHVDVALVRRVEKALEILDRAVGRIDLLVRRDVVAVVRAETGRTAAARCVDAELLDVVELLDQTVEVAEAVGVRVAELLTWT